MARNVAWLGAVVASVLLSLVALTRAEAAAHPEVTSMRLTEASLKEHHTDHFDIELGFAVRRGQKFHLEVGVSENLEKYGEAMTIDMDVVCKDECYAPDFVTRVTKKLRDKTYLLEVTTNVSSPIGKYENVVLYVDSGKKNSTLDAYLYEYPFPVYFLFNPFLKEDKEVYIADKYMQRENILSNYGKVFQGSLNAFDNQVWYYGQSEQVVLDAAFHLIHTFMNRSKASSPMDVIQTISHNQGMMRKKEGGILVGTEEALLEGNWGDFPFENDTSPEIWSSTPDILNRWKQTGRPTRYGQCWVFGALETSLMRAIGVGARQITAFGAPIDMSMLHDKERKAHHVIDNYFDKNGTSVYMDGQQWNFHSWTDVFLQRTPAKYSGWQNSDGTPPGLGPAPIKAVRALDDGAPYNTSMVISTVHSTIREFLVHCNATHEKDDKLKGCHVDKLLKYDSDGLKLIVSSKTLKNGTLELSDVTDEYVDHNKDAFIPYGNDTIGDIPVRQRDSDELKVVPESYKVVVGESIEGRVVMNTENITDGQEIEINLRVTMETRTGELMKTLFTMSEVVSSTGSEISVPYIVDPSTYLQENLNEVFVRVVATASTTGILPGMRSSDQKRTWMDKALLTLDSPEISIDAHENVTLGHSEPIPVSASFTNPLSIPLKKVCVTLHSHILTMHGTDDNRNTKCASLAPGETLRNRVFVKPPVKAGTSYIVASVQGPYLALSQNYVPFHVLESAVSGESRSSPSSTTSNLRKTLAVSSKLEDEAVESIM